MCEDNPRRKAVTETYNADIATVMLSESSPCGNGEKCPNWVTCATGYACRDFLVYHNTGRIIYESREPARKLFRRIFGVMK